jgi:hypothetical protein
METVKKGAFSAFAEEIIKRLSGMPDDRDDEKNENDENYEEEILFI